MNTPKTLAGLILVVVTSLSGCGTQTGNGRVSLEFAAYSHSAWFGLIRPAYAAVSSVTFCFKRLRFKAQNEGTNPDPADDSDNIDFAIGEVTLSPSGTTLGSVDLPPGTYTRIEFDLEKDCASGNSVRVQNTSGDGDHSTDDRITIKFEGTFTRGDTDQKLSLAVKNILDALDTVAADDDIRDKAESASGTF